MKHYSKLLLFMLFILLYTNVYAHPADPTGLLSKYAMYAKDTIEMISSDAKTPGDTSEAVNAWMGVDESGFIILHDVEVNAIIKSPGTIETTSQPSEFNDEVYSNKAIRHVQLYNPNIIRNKVYAPDFINVDYSPTPYKVELDGEYIKTDPKVISPNWPAEFRVNPDITKDEILKNGRTLSPGRYGKITFDPSESTPTAYFTAGEYHIDSLLLDRNAATIQVVKDSGEYCRIFVRSSFKVSNKCNIKIDETKDEYGRVLIYINDEDDSQNSTQFESSIQLDATVLAPFEKVHFQHDTKLNGQILAKSIKTDNQFDGGKGKFYPFVSANLTIVTDSVLEDPNHNNTTPDNDYIDRSGNRTIEVTLKNGLDVQTTIDYEIIAVSPGNPDVDAIAGTDFNVIAKKTATFAKDATTPTTPIQVYVHDDEDDENNENFIIRFAEKSTPEGKITFSSDADRTKILFIADDDPSNTDPSSITLDPQEVLEEKPSGTEVGNIIVTDKEDNVNKVEVTNSVPFTVTGSAGNYKLATTDKFDFEQGPRSYNVEIKATDAGNLSITETFTVDVKPINDSICKAAIASYPVKETEKIVGQSLLSHLTDGDSVAVDNLFEYIPGTSPIHHTHFELKADGTFSYTPDPDLEVTIDSFSYTVRDQATYDKVTDHESDTAWVIINIEPENDNPPIVDTLTLDLFEGETGVVKDLFTDADSLNDSHTIKAWGTSGAHEAITENGDSSITYQTSQDVTTEIFWDSLYYEVTDAGGKVDTGLVVITINPLNDNEPVANADSITVTIGRLTTVDAMLPNDTDLDLPDSLTTIQLTDNPIFSGPTLTGGTATVVGDRRKITLFYDPNLVTEDTVDYIEYVIEDPTTYDPNNTVHNDTGMLKVFVVLPDSTKPIANDDFISLPENASSSTLVSGESSLMTNDQISATTSPLDRVEIGTPPLHGALTLNSDGTFTYDHDDDKEEFFDSFSYTLFDKAGKESLPATVHITIDTLNDNAPTIVNEAVSCDEAGSVMVDIIANDSDNDIFTNFVVALADVQSGMTDGSLSLVGSELTYTNLGTEGTTTDTVFLTVKDSTTYDQAAIRTLIDTVVITVNPINNKTPKGSDKAYTLKEGETVNIIDSLLGLLGDATDADEIVGKDLTATLITPPHHGGAAFAINSNGTFTYVHDDSENFFDSLLFEISDGQFSQRYSARFTIEPVNDNLPVAVNDTFPAIEGATISPLRSILLNDSDTDLYLNGATKVPGVLTVQPLIVGEPYHGTATLTSDGVVTYTHDGSESIIDSMSYQLVDNNGGVIFYDTATIIFTIPQSAPRVDSSFYYDENGDGTVEKVDIYFSDSLFLSETNLTLTWEDGTASTITEKTQSLDGYSVSLSLTGSPAMTTSGALTLLVQHSNMFASESETVTVADRAAPVITSAIYYLSKDENIKDSLEVIFSEDLGTFTSNPYDFFDRITTSNYSMTLSHRLTLDNRVWYGVEDKSVQFVHNNDSIRVIVPNMVDDALGNLQDSTVWAPITLNGEYDMHVELFIVPQPMQFELIDDKMYAKKINPDMLEYYSFPNSDGARGVGFVLTASIPLGAPEEQEGFYTILDAVGNIISPRTAMSFARDQKNHLNGLAIWNGNNDNDRAVGKSAYYCLVEVVLTTDDGRKIPVNPIEKPIGVSQY